MSGVLTDRAADAFGEEHTSLPPKPEVLRVVPAAGEATSSESCSTCCRFDAALSAWLVITAVPTEEVGVGGRLPGDSKKSSMASVSGDRPCSVLICSSGRGIGVLGVGGGSIDGLNRDSLSSIAWVSGVRPWSVSMSLILLAGDVAKTAV